MGVCVCCVSAFEGMGMCVTGEKVTNARGNACLGKFFFFPLCCRPENREEIQTKITPVPLPEKCTPSPRPYSLQISSLLGGKGHTTGVG